MAINLDEKYPGRAQPKSVRYPQGAFKNRTAPDSQDGTYLEQDWANDMSGFLQWLLANAGITANGQVDNALASQYADALIKLVENQQATETKNGTVSIATQQETDLGNDDTKTVTPKKLRFGFSVSIGSTSGYFFFPSWLGGFGFQWGRGTVPLMSVDEGALVSLPKQFSEAIYSISANDGGVGCNSIGAYPNNTSSIRIWARSPGSGNLTGTSYSYFAFGR